MSKLSAKQRKAMPKADFAGPGRSFPIEDAGHARAAISGSSRSANAGNISKATAASVKARARTKLKKGK